LDLSTCLVRDGEIQPLLARFARLRHIVLDGSSLIRGSELREEDWAELGRVCALGGVRRAKDREAALRTWLEAHAESFAQPEVETAAEAEASAAKAAQAERRARKGRKGVASAKVMLRDSAVSGSGSSSKKGSGSAAQPTVPRIRVLPPFPTLRSLTTTASALVPPEDRPIVYESLALGWLEGIRQVRAHRTRLRTSWERGVRVMRFADLEHDDEEVIADSEEAFEGLVDIKMVGSSYIWEADEREYPSPVFCLAGADRKEEHPEGCAHSFAWQVWDNDA
jgi:hypothetical protein